MAVSAPAPATPLLAVEGLRLAATASGTPVPLLDGVSLTVGRGESVAIVGESGSGKSLTMRAAMGLLPVASRSPAAPSASTAPTSSPCPRASAPPCAATGCPCSCRTPSPCSTRS